MSENLKRTRNNLCRVPGWNSTLTVDDVNCWLENFDDLIFCNGHVRKVVFEKVTEKMFKVYTVSI